MGDGLRAGFLERENFMAAYNENLIEVVDTVIEADLSALRYAKWRLSALGRAPRWAC